MIKNKTKKSKTDIILYEKPILKGMVLLALPIFFNNILKVLNDMVDMFFLARMNQPESIIESALAAINIHFPVNFMFLSVGMGLGVAGVAIISQYLGSRKKEYASKYAGQVVGLSLIFGLIISIILLAAAKGIAMAMGATGDTLAFATQYFRIRAVEIIPFFFFLAYQAIRQAEGKTVVPGVLNIIGISINLVLTGVFVSVLNMGVLGAGLATMVGHVLIVPYMVYDLFFSKKNLSIKAKDMVPEKIPFIDITKMMLPAMMAQFLNALGFVIIQSIMLGYGEHVSAGYSAGNRISQIISQSLLAVSTVLATYIGNNVGNNNPKRAKKSYWVALGFIFSLAVILILALMWIREYIITALLSSKASDEVMEVAMRFSMWLLLSQPLMAIIWCDNSYFNGSGNSLLSFISGMTRLWVIRIPLIFLLSKVFDQGYNSIWQAMMISNVIIILFNMILKRFVKLERKVRIEDDKEDKKLADARS